MLLQLLVAKVNAQLLERVVFEYLTVRGMENRRRGECQMTVWPRDGAAGNGWQNDRQIGITKAKTEEFRQHQGRLAYLKPKNVQNTNKVGGIQGSILTRKGNVHTTDDPVKTPTVYGLHERVPRIRGLIRI